MYKTSGYLLIGTGMIHNVLGVLLFWEPLLDMIQSGLFNAIAEQYDRGLVFWFLFFGFLLMVLGRVLSRMTADDSASARLIGWSLLALALAGIVIMPVSGFWLILPQAWLLLRRTNITSGVH